MSELGDTLLFALSATRLWSWSAFKRAFDECRLARAEAFDTPDRLSSFARWRCAALLDSLGHCDFTLEGGSWQLRSGPAIAIRLPAAGLPRAVLCGARSPETLPTLLRHARRFRRSVRVRSSPQHAFRYYAPMRIEFEANDVADMVQFAQDVGIRLAGVPPAWSLALGVGDLSGYVSRLIWSDDPEISWRREDFDPRSGKFGVPRDAPQRLSRYEDPIRGVWKYRLVRGTNSAVVDSAWGRWTALSWASQRIVNYDASKGLLEVRASVPLPRLIARALVLCSGRPPRLALSGADGAPPALTSGDQARWVETYEAVPADIFEVIASKLGQSQEGLTVKEDK